MSLILEDIASYCEFHDCRVTVGSAEAGAIQVDGTGPRRNGYTYGRFHLLSEFQPPRPEDVVSRATRFQFTRGDEKWDWGRQEFEDALATFRKKLAL